MALPKEKQQFWVKLFIVSLSVVIAAIAAEIVFIIFSSVDYLPFTSNSSIKSGLIVIIVIILAVFTAVLIFKKLYRYLKKEFQNA